MARNADRRRPRGTGSIIKLSRSRWRAMYTAPDGQRRSKNFATQGAASEWLNDEVTSIAQGTWSSGDTQSLDTWLEQYVKVYRAGVSLATLESYKGSMKRLEEYAPDLMAMPLANITTADIQEAANALRAEYHSSTVRKTLSLLGQALDRAADIRLIKVNPARNIAVAKSQETHGGREIAPSDWNALETYCMTPAKDWRTHAKQDLLLLMMHTGMRTEEARGLRAEDLTIEGVWVRRALDRKGEPRAPKTDLSHRHIPLPAKILEGLQDRAKQSVSGYLFTTTYDRPIDHTNIARLLKTRLPDHAPHDIRHTWISRAVRNGANLKAVSRLTGDSVETLLRDYTHVTDDDLKATMRLVSNPKILGLSVSTS